MGRFAKKSGFTLVELTVTMGIFLLVVSVVLVQYRSFDVSADFSNAVENVVLTLREAQVYGAGGKTANVSGADCGGSAFNCAYGVQFQNAGTSYIVFVDKNSDRTYNNGEEIQTITLPSGMTISEISGGGMSLISPLNVVFKRPFPDALINNILDSASITLAKNGDSATVSITSAGQITVQ